METADIATIRTSYEKINKFIDYLSTSKLFLTMLKSEKTEIVINNYHFKARGLFELQSVNDREIDFTSFLDDWKSVLKRKPDEYTIEHFIAEYAQILQYIIDQKDSINTYGSTYKAYYSITALRSVIELQKIFFPNYKCYVNYYEQTLIFPELDYLRLRITNSLLYNEDRVEVLNGNIVLYRGTETLKMYKDTVHFILKSKEVQGAIKAKELGKIYTNNNRTNRKYKDIKFFTPLSLTEEEIEDKLKKLIRYIQPEFFDYTVYDIKIKTTDDAASSLHNLNLAQITSNNEYEIPLLGTPYGYIYYDLEGSLQTSSSLEEIKCLYKAI